MSVQIPNSLEECWQIINVFQSSGTSCDKNFVELESAFTGIREYLNLNELQKGAGYSKTFSRYVTDATVAPTKKTLKELRRHYWARHKQLLKLERQIKEREGKIRAKCEHVWEKDYESRDHRSHYDCRKCGAYR